MRPLIFTTDIVEYEGAVYGVVYLDSIEVFREKISDLYEPEDELVMKFVSAVRDVVNQATSVYRDES